MNTTEKNLADYFGFTVPELRKALLISFAPSMIAICAFVGILIYFSPKWMGWIIDNVMFAIFK